jgi:dipeptidyl aminopeptidase/acylaminoacyl peptidase
MSQIAGSFGGVVRLSVAVACILVALAAPASAGQGLSFEQLAALRTVGDVAMSPDGATIAYTLNVPRQPGKDTDGKAWRELHVVTPADGLSRSFIGGEVNISGIRFTPDGKLITYLAKRGCDEHDSLWAIPLAGGESRRLLAFETAIADYRVSPDGTRIAFIATQPECEARKEAAEAGYSQEVFEEDWLPKKVWLAALPVGEKAVSNPSESEIEVEEPTALPLDGSAFHVRWSPDGKSLAVDLAPRPLIDDRYMMRRVHIVDATDGQVRAAFDNPGKLGEFGFSPDGRTVAMISAADPNDPAAGRLVVAPTTGGSLKDMLPDLEGHVAAFTWRNAHTLLFLSDEGVETRLAEVDLGTGGQTTHAVSASEKGGARVPVMRDLSLSADGSRVALVGDTPFHPREVFAMELAHGKIDRLTDNNPWLRDVDLAPQEVIRSTARDGLELEGVLMRPKNAGGEPLPLIMMVHGGPEGHRRNAWLTRYGSPGQLAAGKGYAVFYPNYRGSTGRGVAFSKLGQGDAAGKEFDDLVDALEDLVARRIVDKDRVGITGGSYGGYATGWCATRYTEHFRAGVMFVGISNEISKGLTSEIPVEDKMVHTFYEPYSRWEFRLQRSPIFHAEKSRTALLIAGGTADSRVHPSQSLQLYRALKLIDKTPVRYVRYPGEGHGNSRAASRDDYARRLMRWMDHFVMEKKTDLPPWQLDHGQGVGEGEAE